MRAGSLHFLALARTTNVCYPDTRVYEMGAGRRSYLLFEREAGEGLPDFSLSVHARCNGNKGIVCRAPTSGSRHARFQLNKFNEFDANARLVASFRTFDGALRKLACDRSSMSSELQESSTECAGFFESIYMEFCGIPRMAEKLTRFQFFIAAVFW